MATRNVHELEIALEEARRQLQQAKKLEAIGRLAGGIAHDFNNLLTVVLGYADLMLSEMAPTDPLRADVEEIQSAGMRGSDLTRQLLAFSREQAPERASQDLNDAVEEAVRMLRRMLAEDIRLKLDTAPSLWKVMADRGQIVHSVVSLALSARDAMPQGGTLTIETANVQVPTSGMPLRPPVPGDYVALRVRDTGHGAATSKAGKAPDLDLTVSQTFVEQSDGYLFVESTPEHGAEVVIYLPRGGGASRVPAAGLAETAAKRGTILLVEDEAGLRDLVSRVLRKAGYVVHAAADAQEALLVIAGNVHVDLVLTDIVMPGMDGFALADRIRERRKMPILFMTGFPADEHASRGEPLLMKPFTPAEVTARVADALARVHA